MIAKSPRAMMSIRTLLDFNPNLNQTYAQFFVSNGAASAVSRAAGHVGG